ncbi:MAG: hypothetical protein GYB65_04780 [Chloroflexi bacterium]|nr:hypothetical protein [Chloroflexota bacterium]
MPYQFIRDQRPRAAVAQYPVSARRTARITVAIPERVLDMLPGGLAWIGLVMVVLGAYYAPLTLVLAAALLALYSALRFTLAGTGTLWGLLHIRRWSGVDWRIEYIRRMDANTLPLELVHHLVIIPNYNEDLTLLRRTLIHLSQQAQTASMSVVLAMEGQEDGAMQKGTLLKKEFGAAFEHFFVVTHPRGIPGEMQCKSANQSWAARWAKRMLVDELGYDLNHIVVTSMDADTVWHPAYFESLGVSFATDAQRYATYWQAPIRYHGNVWATNPLMRILHAYSSAWELAYLAAPWWQALPMSSYSMSLRLLDRVGYWDPDVIADEWHMYIKSFFQRAGNVRLQPIFLPFWAHATAGRGVARAIKERYLQTLRHAWGAKEIGYTLALWNQTRQRGSLGLLVRVAHDNLLAGLGWIVMMLGAQLPMLFHPALVRDNLTSAPFILLQISITTIMIVTIVFWALDLRLRPHRPQPWTLSERIYELASLPLLAIITFVCVTLPALDAQTRLMLGKPLVFRVSTKR